MKTVKTKVLEDIKSDINISNKSVVKMTNTRAFNSDTDEELIASGPYPCDPWCVKLKNGNFIVRHTPT